MSKVRIGLMGFGEIPRHVFRMCIDDPRIEVVAISEFGSPEILSYLVSAETKGMVRTHFDDNFIVSEKGKARVVKGGNPGDVPWDMFDVDIVVDGTWKFRYAADMHKHIKAGARRVILTSVPYDKIDRIVVKGVNDHTISPADRLVSAGSATTNSTAIMLKILHEHLGLEYAMFTSVHSYTSDQPLRDKAGTDFRRSRSAAENIIPNESLSPRWIQHIMPEFRDRVEGFMINVPVPNGSLLDLTAFLKPGVRVTREIINDILDDEAKKHPDIIEIARDPIVSTDVIDNKHSIVYDREATMVSQSRMVKTLCWYHSAFAMAARIKELILAYDELEKKGGKK